MNWIDTTLNFIKPKIEYGQHHGGCPPRVKRVSVIGRKEAKAEITRQLKIAELKGEIKADKFWIKVGTPPELISTDTVKQHLAELEAQLKEVEK